MLRSVDLYVAPNIGGESFGIVLLEAMAVGTPVLASDLEAFRAVLDAGRSGRCSRPAMLTISHRKAADLLDDPDGRAALVALGRATARSYDWSTVARDIVRVYETVAVDAPDPFARRGPYGRRYGALSPDETINWRPIRAAKFFERCLRRGCWTLRVEHNAPMRRGKRRAAIGAFVNRGQRSYIVGSGGHISDPIKKPRRMQACT